MDSAAYIQVWGTPDLRKQVEVRGARYIAHSFAVYTKLRPLAYRKSFRKLD